MCWICRDVSVNLRFCIEKDSPIKSAIQVTHYTHFIRPYAYAGKGITYAGKGITYADKGITDESIRCEHNPNHNLKYY